MRKNLKRQLYKEFCEFIEDQKHGNANGVVIYSKTYNTGAVLITCNNELAYVIADPTGYHVQNYRKEFRLLYPTGPAFEMVEAKRCPYSLYTTIYLRAVNN